MRLQGGRGRCGNCCPRFPAPKALTTVPKRVHARGAGDPAGEEHGEPSRPAREKGVDAAAVPLMLSAFNGAGYGCRSLPTSVSGCAVPATTSTFLDTLLVQSDHGTVVGAQGAHELFAQVRLGEPVCPGRGSDDPVERVDLARDPLAR